MQKYSATGRASKVSLAPLSAAHSFGETTRVTRGHFKTDSHRATALYTFVRFLGWREAPLTGSDNDTTA